MKKKKIMKYFSSILAFIMVLALFTPFSAAANTQETKPFKPNGISESNMQLKAAIAEQLNLLGGSPKLHKDLKGLSGDEQVAVIVHLSEKPVALEKGIKELAGKTFTATEAKQVKAKVTAQQSAVKKEMSVKNISYKQGFSFDTVLNGFAATVKADDLDKLLAIKGVTLVEPDAVVKAFGEKSTDVSASELEKKDELEATMNTSISFLGIEKLWEEGYEGQGIKVAVLDTGIDKDHPEFEGIYKGGKNFVPHTGTNYARDRAEDDPSETSPKDRPANKPEFDADGRSFYTDHGTHVAGTIAAIGANEYGIKGIAPKVDLYAYRVLGAYGSGSTSGIIKAIDTAVIEEMDVINLSLGGGANTETDAGSFAINNAMMAGTISVIATGNDGPNRGTMGTPGTARLGIAVGNTTNPETKYDGKVTIKVGDYDYSKQLNFMGTTFGQELATQLDGEYELVAVPGVGAVTDYDGIDVDGKVALISRGEIAFVDKIAAAKKNGAIATIIHNFAGGTNAPGASGTFLGDSFAFVPTLDMSVTDGAAIRDALASGTGTITFGNFGSAKTLGDEVNDSSSRGPSTPNFDIKPDVTAPGTNIMSSIPAYGADFPDASYDESYDRFTGTSMATPHITGIAALIKQANPDWNAFDVKVALSNTAKILNTKYDVFSQGAGRVDAYAAAHPSVLAYAVDTANNDGEVVENLKGTVTFGPQKLDKDISVTKQILVKDLKGEGGEYNVTVDVTKEFKGAKVTVDKPTFTLDGEQTINVTLTASKTEGTMPGDEILGYIHISTGDKDKTVTSLSVNETNLKMTPSATKQLKVTETETVVDGNYNEISLPFAADFAGAAAVQLKDLDITETDLSFNGDGVNDEATFYFTITGDVGTNYIELWDIMDPEGGEYGDGYIGYLHAGSGLAAGSYRLNITGEYGPWGGSGVEQIPDGLYTVDFTAMTVSGNPAIISDYVGPIVVKTTKPEVNGSVADGKVTGQITDKYIVYNDELALYGLEYDLNEKLKASYVITKNGEAAEAVLFQLEQDGSFALTLEGFNEETDTVSVLVEDAAGNKSEATTLSKESAAPDQGEDPANEDKGGEDSSDGTTPEDEGTDGSNPDEIGTESQATLNKVKVASVDSKATSKLTLVKEYEVPSTSVKNSNKLNDGPVYNMTNVDSGKDVTKEAKYTVTDESVAAVSDEGLVTAKKVGKTTITIKHGENTATVNVTVENPPVVTPDPPSVPSNPGQVDADNNSVQNQIKDAKTDEVVVSVRALTEAQPEISVKVSGESMKALAQSVKPLVIKSGDTAVSVPNKVLKDIYADYSGSATISVKMTKSEGINGAVSATFDFTIKAEKDGKSHTISTFSEPIEVSIPVTGAVKDPRKTAAYYVNESKKSLDYVGGTLENKNFVFKTNHFSKFVVVENAKTFTDIQKHWAQDEIEVLASRAITSGATDSTFNPEGKVTRAEFAVLIARALNLNVKEFEGIFKDVTKGNEWAYAGIEAASRAGIVTGKSKDTFDPNALITREEIATMIVRAVKYQDASVLKGLDTSKSFKDDKEISKFAKEFVKQAAALGIVNGRDANKFVPKANASRAEAAAMLYRSLEKLNEI
ncbi:S8 family serine peptidase [Cytobacillus sp. FJAT-53684]|uniref:S8 family serine peptidase n=1 Tax=Cytobacillus mangrovibacter TaxID=3299024 RepID=A0ABW6K2Y9_9BACI